MTDQHLAYVKAVTEDVCLVTEPDAEHMSAYTTARSARSRSRRRRGLQRHKYIAATLDDIRRTRKPLSTRHRIITVQGQTRDIVIIGEPLHDDTGEVIGTQGFYLDVTPTNEERQESISQALTEIAANRASIEQAKGVLMYIYGVGPDAAFDLLRWRSQDGNVKLRALAEQLLADVLALKHDKGPPLSRETFDGLLLTAHERVTAKHARNTP